MFVYVLGLLMVIVLTELIGRNLRDLFGALFPKQSQSTSFYAGVMVEKARLLMEDNVEKEGKKVVSALQSILGKENSSFSTGSSEFSAHSESFPPVNPKKQNNQFRFQQSLSHVAVDDENSKGTLIHKPRVKKSKSFYQNYMSNKIDRMIDRWLILQRLLQFLCVCIIGFLIYFSQRAIREPHNQTVWSDKYVLIEDTQVWFQCISLLIILYMTWTPLICPCNAMMSPGNSMAKTYEGRRSDSGRHKQSKKIQEKTTGIVVGSVNSDEDDMDENIQEGQDELYVPPPDSF